MEDPNYFNQVAFLLDENKLLVKWGLYGLSATGSILVLRNVRPFQKFRDIQKIPSSFFDHKVKLNGTVTSVEPGPPVLLRVDHRPIIGSRLRRMKQPGLGVKILSINISNPGISWLQHVTVTQPISFTLFKKDRDYAHCLVYHKVNKYNVADVLVKFGYAVVEPIDYDLERNKKYLKYYKNLLKLENKAEKERVGLWAADTDEEELLNDNFIEQVKSVFYKLRS